MEKSEYTKLLVCMIVMLGGIAVPYTGTALMALVFVGIIQFEAITECFIKFIKAERGDKE